MGCERSHLENEQKYVDNQNRTERKKTIIGVNEPIDLSISNKENLFEGEIKLKNDLNFAKELIRNELYKEALKEYQRINEKYANNWQVYTRLGECHRLMNNLQEALKWHLAAFNEFEHETVCNSLSICYRLKQDYENSEKYAKIGIKINPKEASNYTSLGTLYLLKKQKQRSEQCFLLAIKVDARYAQAYLRLAELYCLNSYHQMALDTLEKYHQDITSDNLQIMYQIGILYKDNFDKNDQALQLFKKCLQINPNHFQSYNQIGYINISKKNWESARENFNKSVQISRYQYAYNGLGNVFKATRQYASAISNYQIAIQIDPKYSTPYCGLANIYKQKGEFHQAIEMYKKSIELSPKDINPYNGLGNLYKTKGNLEQAIKYFKQSIQINPKNGFAYYGLGVIYKTLKEFDEAINYFVKTIKVNPKDSVPYNGIGGIYQQLSQFQEAEKWYKKCIQIDAKNEKILIILGNLYKKLNRQSQAEDMYLRAYEVNPKNHTCCNSLAVYYSTQKECHKAVYFYKKAIENNPLFPLAYINLSMTLIDIENYQEAFKYLKEAKRIIDTSERDLCGGRKELITQTLQNFQREMESWQFKIKQGYMTDQDKKKISQMKENFQKKFEKMFNLNDEGHKGIDSTKLNKPLLNILEKIKQDDFSLENIEEITAINYKIFEKNNDDFSIMAFLFCKYFWVEKKGKNNCIKQIQKSIDQKLDTLSALYPPSNGSSNVDGRIQLKVTFEPKKINLFNKTQYFKDYTYLIIEIQQINKHCGTVLPKFKQFIYKISSQEGGSHVKANLKLSDKQAQKFKVYIRVMEKMFKEISSRKEHIIQSVERKLNSSKESNMQAVMSYLIQVWTQEITTILQDRWEKKIPTKCCISDFVRGKAVFKSIEDVERAANRIIDECGPRGFEIVEIDNRLLKETKDLVFKICIDGVVCEFQMAMDFDATQYNFSHSLYEIKRSPLGCIFGSFLFLSKFDVLSFVKQAKQLQGYFRSIKKPKQDDLKSKQAVQFLLQAFKSNL